MTFREFAYYCQYVELTSKPPEDLITLHPGFAHPQRHWKLAWYWDKVPELRFHEGHDHHYGSEAIDAFETKIGRSYRDEPGYAFARMLGKPIYIL